MRWPVLLMVLLVPLAGAVERDPGLSPVQTVIDAVPGIVTAAIREAGRDGTPDAAEASAAALERFAAGLRGNFNIPADSRAGQAGLDAALPYALQVAQLTTAVPGDIGHVERNVAACTEWGASKGAGEGRRWIEDGKRAASNVQAYDAAFAQFAEQAPVGVDAAPLRQAAAALAAFTETRGQTGEQCFQELEVALNITVSVPDLWLRLIPSTSWPGGQVVALGSSPADAVRLSAPGVLQAVALPATPHFVTRLSILPQAPLGDTVITATADGRSVEAALRLDQAPSYLRLVAPRLITLGEAIDVQATVTSDLAVTGSLTWRDGAVTPLDQGAASQTFTPDAAGDFVVRVTYPGTERIAPSSATIVVQVLDPQAPVDPAAVTVRDAPVAQPAFGNASPWWLVIAAALILAAVGARVIKPKLRIRPPRAVPDAAPGEDASVPSGFVSSIAGFMRGLVRLGRAGPGTTVREAAAEHKEIRPLVPAFERARYADIAPPPGARDQTSGVLKRLLQRLRGKP